MNNLPKKIQILFVCIENSNRSQMAEAFANIHGQGQVAAFSAGSQASGQVNPRAIAMMKEIGYDLSKHRSKKLDEVPTSGYDAIITMGCGDACPYVAGRIHEDWALPDPKHLNDNDFRKVRDEIEVRVKALLARLNTAR